MTALLRTRGSTSEMARLFGAEPDAGLIWRESVWTGDPVPVVVQEGDHRHLTTMRWGLPAEAFAKPVPSKQRGTLYSRDFWRTGSRLDGAAHLSRCLIILESFAYPMTVEGGSTRSWIGLWDHPLAAWAGLCLDGRCAGLLIGANDRLAPLSRTMPRLLLPEDHAPWLAGGSLLSLGPAYAEAEFYRENLGERWSTGRPDETASPLFAMR